MLNINKSMIEELNIESSNDLRRYVLESYLELSQSSNIEHRLTALKEMSKYLFNTTGCCIPISAGLKDNDNSIM